MKKDSIKNKNNQLKIIKKILKKKQFINLSKQKLIVNKSKTEIAIINFLKNFYKKNYQFLV